MRASIRHLPLDRGTLLVDADLLTWLMRAYATYIAGATVAVFGFLWVLRDKYFSRKVKDSSAIVGIRRPAITLLRDLTLSFILAIPLGYVTANFNTRDAKQQAVQELLKSHQTLISAIQATEETYWKESSLRSSWPREFPFPLILPFPELHKWRLEYQGLCGRVTKLFSPGTAIYCLQASSVLDEPPCIFVLRAEVNLQTKMVAGEQHCGFLAFPVESISANLQVAVREMNREADVLFIPSQKGPA